MLTPVTHTLPISTINVHNDHAAIRLLSAQTLCSTQSVMTSITPAVAPSVDLPPAPPRNGTPSRARHQNSGSSRGRGGSSQHSVNNARGRGNGRGNSQHRPPANPPHSPHQHPDRRTVTANATASAPPNIDPTKNESESKEPEEDVEAEVCFICASTVVHNSVAPCNHRTCHICALRLRALYKTRACAHCRVS